MTAPALSIRIAANLAELKKNLAEGKDQIETTTAAMGKLATSLQGDKLIQNANNIVAAVDKIGGVSKLTESEQARLNATLAKAIEKYEVMGKDAPSAMVALEKATRGAGEETDGLFTKLSASALAVGTAFGTFLGNLAYDALKKIGTELFEVAKRGVELAGVATSFESLTKAVGQSGAEMISVSRTASKGLIADLDLMAASNKALLLGLPVTADSMGTMAATAVALGKAMKQDAAKSFDDLITALGRSSPMILDNLGLSVKVGEANDAYAKSLGKTSDSLTDNEKKLAFYNAAMEAAKRKVEEVGGLQLTLADRFTQVKTTLTNFTDSLGIAIAKSPALNALFEGIARGLQDALGSNQTVTVEKLIGMVNSLAISSVGLAETLINVGVVGTRTWVFLQDGISGLVEAQFRLRAGMRDLIPTEQYKKEAAELRRLADEWKRSTDEAYDRQAKIEQGFTSARTALDSLRKKMEEQSAAGVKSADVADAVAASLNRQGVAARGAAGGAQAHSDAAGGAKGKQDEYMKAVDAFVDMLSTKRVTEKAVALAEALKREGVEAALAAPKQAVLAKQIQELHDQGARLPPVLQDIWVRYATQNEILPKIAKNTTDIVGIYGNYAPIMTAAAQKTVEFNHAVVEANAGLEKFIVPAQNAHLLIGKLATTKIELQVPPEPWEVLRNQLTGAAGYVSEFVRAAQGGLEGLKNYAWDFANGFISTTLDILVPGLGQLVSAAWPLIRAGLEAIWGGIKSFFSSVWDGIKGFFTGNTDPEFLAGLKNEGWLKNYKLPTDSAANGRSGDGGSDFGAMPRLEDVENVHPPALAKGGIVKARPGGTVVRVAEAGQDEMITPLPLRPLPASAFEGADAPQVNVYVGTRQIDDLHVESHRRTVGSGRLTQSRRSVRTKVAFA